MLATISKIDREMTVLILEDDEICREVLCDVIKLFQPTWTIYEAGNGQEGLKMAQILIPDLLILDFHMPLMNGYQVALALQQRLGTAQIPLILSTSEDAYHPQIVYLRALCQGILYKPFSFYQLERVLEQMKPGQTASGFKPYIEANIAMPVLA